MRGAIGGRNHAIFVPPGCSEDFRRKRKGPGEPGPGTGVVSSYQGYWQLGNLKLPIWVLQLNVPFVLRYSVV